MKDLKSAIDIDTLRFTSTEQGDELVRSHLKTIITELNDVGLSDYTLVIIGSFGRGEGIVASTNMGQLGVVNDYDLLIHKENGFSYLKRKELRKLARKIESELSLWHFDLIPISDEKLNESPPGMMLFDTKYGGQVVYGVQPKLLEKIVLGIDYRIGNDELLNLLINRQVTLVEGHPETYKDYSLKFKARQLAKAWYALVDVLLVESGAYATQYKKKEINLTGLDVCDRSDRLMELIDFSRKARLFRLQADDLAKERMYEIWKGLAEQFQVEILRLTGVVAGQEILPEDLKENWRGTKKDSNTNMLNVFYKCLSSRKKKRVVELELYKALADQDRTPQEMEQLVKDWYSAIS